MDGMRLATCSRRPAETADTRQRSAAGRLASRRVRMSGNDDKRVLRREPSSRECDNGPSASSVRSLIIRLGVKLASACSQACVHAAPTKHACDNPTAPSQHTRATAQQTSSQQERTAKVCSAFEHSCACAGSTQRGHPLRVGERRGGCVCFMKSFVEGAPFQPRRWRTVQKRLWRRRTSTSS